MKPEQVLRALTTVLLMTLNVIAGLLLSSAHQIRSDVGDLKADVKTVNKDIQGIQLNLYGAQKDISALQKSAANSFLQSSNAQR